MPDTTQTTAPPAPEPVAQPAPQFSITLPPGGGSYRLNADGTLTQTSGD